MRFRRSLTKNLSNTCGLLFMRYFDSRMINVFSFKIGYSNAYYLNFKNSQINFDESVFNEYLMGVLTKVEQSENNHELSTFDQYLNNCLCSIYEQIIEANSQALFSL